MDFDIAAFSAIARWLKTTVAQEKLHLAILPMVPIGSADTYAFNKVFECWKEWWKISVRPDSDASLQSYVELFAGAQEVVLVTSKDGIVAIGTLHYFDLDNAAHLQNRVLSSMDADWAEVHRKQGIRSVLFGANLIANPELHLLAPPRTLGRLYILTMMRNFVNSGLDMALCRMRKATSMDKHGLLVGGKVEGMTRMPGRQEEGAVMTVTSDIAKRLPYEALGPGFEQFWKDKAVAWKDVFGLNIRARL